MNIESPQRRDHFPSNSTHELTSLVAREITDAQGALDALSGVAPADTLADVRQKLDLADAAIAHMLNARALLVSAAARIKDGEGLPHRDPKREDEVIAHVQRQATVVGPAPAAHVMRAVIEACQEATAEAMTPLKARPG